MRQLSRAAALMLVVTVGTGCYHAIVDTGRAPSPVVVEQTFAKSWIGGLIAPKPMETHSQCPKGVAKVETQHSFVNMLVGAVTFGIFTPMTIKATCAA